MIVVDTSALLEALVGWPPPEELRERLADDGDLHAPHLLDVEFLHALRALVRRGAITSDRAEDARADLAELRIARYPHVGLADRVWALRGNLSAYDAAFVALSEALQAPLVTTDLRIARAAGHAAAVEVFSAPS